MIATARPSGNRAILGSNEARRESEATVIGGVQPVAGSHLRDRTIHRFSNSFHAMGVG